MNKKGLVFELKFIKSFQFSSSSHTSVTLISSSLLSLNSALETTRYRSTNYEPRGSTDLVTLRYGPHKAQIPLDIKYRPQPVLIDPKDGSLEDMVTICIKESVIKIFFSIFFANCKIYFNSEKTFERYPCLNRLIDSIRDFYPKLRIIIADDSINFKEINRENVDQFKMPQAIGFNNGKNLAISQVRVEQKKLIINKGFESR